jgi:FkbM family methyltransferase
MSQNNSINFNEHKLVNFKGNDFYVYNTNIDHWISRCIIVGIGWEEEQMDLIINDFSDKKSNMLDIGGDIGTWSVGLSKYFNKVITFEPNIDHYNTILKNLELNKIDNVETYNKACSSTMGKCNMTTIHQNTVDINQDGGVDMVKLDDFINDDISFIKIDVEGHEFEVLKGCEKIILKNKPIIYLETHPNPVNCPKINSENFLEGLGYKKIKTFDTLNSFWKI